MNRLDPNDVLTPVNHPDQPNQILGGLYGLKLPAANFNIKGFYNIVIRPKEFKTKIVDCGNLSSIPDVKGIILDSNRSDLSDFQNKLSDQQLVGYRIEYLNPDGSKIPNLFRIITSNNRCEPVTENLETVTQKAVKYRFTSTGSLVFCTLTPSSAPSIKSNAIPIIGQPNTDIIISNTFFNPLMIEVELTSHSIDTLAIGLYGNQVKDLSSGMRTIYDFDENIYKQFNEFEILSPNFNEPTHEVRQIKEVIDTSQLFSTIIEGL